VFFTTAIKKLLKNKKIYYTAIFVCSFLFLGGYYASAATLSITSGFAALAPGDTATLYVVLNSEGVAVNNTEAAIKFPSDLVDVVSLSKSGSVFSLWVEEPYFSNSTGIITFNGGVPTPGFNGSRGSVIAIVVKAKKAGQADFTFSTASVRANDGLGTDVLSGQSGKTLTIISKDTPNTTPDTPATTSTPPIDNLQNTPISQNLFLQILSPTHPNQDRWYNDKNPIFRWNIPTGADAVRTSIDNNDSGTPRITYSPVINEKKIKDSEDGTWYFKVRARKNNTWGPISTYVVKIDTVAPQKKKVNFSYDDNTKILNITADIQDATSGIERYEIFINNTLIKNIPAEEFVNGNYKLEFNTPGDNTVKLLAFDHAGNSVDSYDTFYTTSVVAPQLESVPAVNPSNEKLLITGLTQTSDTDITVYVKNNYGELITLKTKSNSDLNFFVLTPKLKSGVYDIWAETGSGNNIVSSLHIYTKVTPRLLITIGSSTIIAFYLFTSTFLIIILLLLGAYYLGHHYSRLQHKLRMRTAVVKGDNHRILLLIRKRLEKHLEILQHTRRERILTKEEKEIKEAIENDLDEIDKTLKE